MNGEIGGKMNEQGRGNSRKISEFSSKNFENFLTKKERVWLIS